MKNILYNIKELSNKLSIMPGIINNIDVKSRVELQDLIHDSELLKYVSKLFYDGHYSQAVEKAYKFLNNLVKKKCKADSSLDGSSLMEYAFSPKNPVLMINNCISRSEQDEQLGYMKIYSGSITGIRNPRAHECDWYDDKTRAIQMLIMADHLIGRVRKARVKT